MNFKLSFAVIGVQKAGTSSLHEWLKQHPDVCLPTIKETHFFSLDSRFQKGLPWYRRQFVPGEAASVFGEIDPDYLYFEEALPRLKRFSEHVKVIVMLRNPVERAYSQYLMSRRRGHEQLTFGAAIRAERSRLSSGGEFARVHFSYISRSLYGPQIRRLKELVRDDDVLFLNFDDLLGSESRNRVVESLLNFLALRPVQLDLTVIANQASVPKSKFLARLIFGRSKLRKLVAMVLPKGDWRLKFAMFLDKINQKPPSDNPPARAVSAYTEIDQSLAKTLIEDLSVTEGLTGLDLGGWKAKIESISGSNESHGTF